MNQSTTDAPARQNAQSAAPLAARWRHRMTAAWLERNLAETSDWSGIPRATDREAWLGLEPTLLASIEARATAERGTAWPQPLISQYARYFRDGNRRDYEGSVGQRGSRLSRAVLMAARTASADWVDEVADGIGLVCEQSSWCWAAHDDTFTTAGYVIPNVESPYLDLGAGEVAAQLAWADHVLGEALDDRVPGLRRRIRHEFEVRVVRPFLERRDWHWLGLDGDVHNWNPWIHGNIITAAMFLIDDRVLRARVIERALEGVDRYVASIPADGAIDEGFSYWWNGAGRLLETLDLLARATNARLDGASVPVVRELVRFPHRMHLGGAWHLNVADGRATSPSEPWQVPFSWGMQIGDSDVVAHALSQRGPISAVADESLGLGRVLRCITDRDWIDASTPSSPLIPSVWLPSVQILVAREFAGSSDGLTLAVKGGHNGEHHNHKDVGSFVVALDGRPLVVDAGKPTYTAQTFGPNRYDIRAMQSGWHNVPAPWGLEQGLGTTHGARLLSVDEADAAIGFELAQAYDLPSGSSWIRTARLDRDHSTVAVSDSWLLHRPDAVLYRGVQLNLIIAGDVEKVSANVLRIVGDAHRTLEIEWNGSSVDVSTEIWRLDDEELRAVWGARLTRVTLSAPAGEGEMETSGTLGLTMRAMK